MAAALLPVVCMATVTNNSDLVTVTGIDSSTGATAVLSDLNCAINADVSLAGLGYVIGTAAGLGRVNTTLFHIERKWTGSTGSVTCTIQPYTPEMASRVALAQTLRDYNARAALIAANAAGLSYQFTGATSAPLAGQVAFDNVTLSAATKLRANNADLSGRSVTDRLDRWAIGDEITVRAMDGGARVTYVLAGAPASIGGYREVLVTYSGADGVLSAGDDVVVERIAKGSTGAAGLLAAASPTEAVAGTDNTKAMTPATTAHVLQTVTAGSYLGLVATCSDVPAAINTGLTQIMTRSPHRARDVITSLQVQWPNWYAVQAGEVGTGSTATITASVEYPAGVFTQLKFAGSASGSIPDLTTITSDAVAVNIPDGDTFWLRSYWTNAGGIVFATGDSDGNLGQAIYGASGIADNTMSDPLPTLVANYYPPLAIIGQTNRSAVLVIGDSRAHGAGDTVDLAGFIGNLDRSVSPRLASSNVAVSGSRATQFLGSHTRRAALATYCTDVVIEYDINGLRINQTAAQTKANVEAIAALFPNQRCWAHTLEPDCSGSPSYASTGVQVIADAGQNTQRIAYNALVRAGLVGFDGYFDVASVLESKSAPGKWAVPGDGTGYTNDGLHANQAGYLLLQNAGVVDPTRMLNLLAPVQRFATKEQVKAGKSTNLPVSPASLGLGAAAFYNVGVAGGTIPLNSTDNLLSGNNVFQANVTVGVAELAADFWAVRGAVFTAQGGLGTMGNNDFMLWSNGYRNSGATWTSFNAGASTGAAMLTLGRDGTVTLSADATTPSGAFPTARITMTATGDWSPAVNAASDLGATGKAWKDIHSTGVLDLAGGKIKFPATASLSTDPNTLDDYEEGTFTLIPALATPGTSSWATTVANGRYQKIARNVFMTGDFSSVLTKGTGSGAFSLGGYPFTVANVAAPHPVGGMGVNWTWPSGKTQVTGVLSGTAMFLQAIGTGAAAVNFAASNMADGLVHTVRIAGTQEVSN